MKSQIVIDMASLPMLSCAERDPFGLRPDCSVAEVDFGLPAPVNEGNGIVTEGAKQ